MISRHTERTSPSLWLLVLIVISGTLAMHMFVPALPDAARTFGASRSAMQMTVSIYILGLAGGQLVYGPLSDSMGRRPMLILGLALYTVAGFVAALSADVHTLVAARLFQALGGCAGLALGRAIVRDTSQSNDAVAKLAILNLMMMVGPGLAPLLGSGLSLIFGWRSIFLFLALLGGVTLMFTWYLLPETVRPIGNIKITTLASDYTLLLRSPSFMGFALGGGCATTSIYSFIAAAPFIVSSQLHRSLGEVGLYLSLLMVGMGMGNAITRHLVHRFTIERLLIVGNAVSVLSAIVLLVVTLASWLTIVSAIGLMFVFGIGAGTASPGALTKALSGNPTVIGSAAGLYGFIQMSVGALCTYMVGFGHNPTLSAAIVLTVTATLGQVGFWVAIGWDRLTIRHIGTLEIVCSK